MHMPKSNLDFHAFDISQVKDSTCSPPSTLSVPSDLGRWFSSYAYESPSLDMSQSSSPKKNHGFRNSFPRGTVHDKTGLYIERNREIEGNFRDYVDASNNDVLADKCESDLVGHGVQNDQYVEIPGYCSHSTPSEPPDIGIWFSSYAYESPVLDMGEGIIGATKEDNYMKEDFAITAYEKTEELGLKKSEDVITCCENKPFKYGQCENKPPIEDKDLEVSSTNNEVSEVKFLDSENFSQVIANYESNAKYEMSPNKFNPFTQVRDSTQLAKPIHTLQSRNLMVSSSTHMEANEKGNGKEVAENGFVCTRAKKFKKSKSESCEALRSSGSSSRSLERCGAVKRSGLSDLTNLRAPCNEEEMKVGKWRCPQKSKPRVAPPLKQLRLERWVHRL